LNALDEQTLDRGLWEVVVAHDPADPETAKLLAEHPLASARVLRAVPVARRQVGAKRNQGVAEARGATVVFTDDDCRPPADWLEHVWAAAQRRPEAIIQGPVSPDPDESAMTRSPYPRTQSFTAVPTPWAEGCNIAYPRDLVQQVGGFSERMDGGEDTDLNLRVRAAGAAYIGEPAMLTYHAILDEGLRGWIRASLRWGELPGVFKRHPELRRQLHLGIFWKREHLRLLIGLIALGAGRGKASRALGLIPWAAGRGAHGGNLRGQLRDLLELPGWAIVDLTELVVLARGSIRHRTVVL
jgi:glycosyltransferase involved in cell wall biosynthesis